MGTTKFRKPVTMKVNPLYGFAGDFSAEGDDATLNILKHDLNELLKKKGDAIDAVDLHDKYRLDNIAAYQSGGGAQANIGIEEGRLATAKAALKKINSDIDDKNAEIDKEQDRLLKLLKEKAKTDPIAAQQLATQEQIAKESSAKRAADISAADLSSKTKSSSASTWQKPLLITGIVLGSLALITGIVVAIRKAAK